MVLGSRCRCRQASRSVDENATQLDQLSFDGKDLTQNLG